MLHIGWHWLATIEILWHSLTTIEIGWHWLETIEIGWGWLTAIEIGWHRLASIEIGRHLLETIEDGTIAICLLLMVLATTRGKAPTFLVAVHGYSKNIVQLIDIESVKN